MPLRQPLTYLELYTPLKMLILKVQKCILKGSSYDATVVWYHSWIQPLDLVLVTTVG